MTREELTLKVKQVLVDSLRLRMEPSEIADDSALFGEGLGLDSVDAIELVAAIEKHLGTVIGSEEDAQKAFQSVGTLVDYLVEQGALA